MESERRRKVMGVCADRNRDGEGAFGSAASIMPQERKLPKPKFKPTAKKPFARLGNPHHHHKHRYPSKINSATQIPYKLHVHQRGIGSSSRNLRRFLCCKLASAKSICRHRKYKGLSSLPQPATSFQHKRSSKALAKLHNVTTNYFLGAGSQVGPGGEEKTVNNDGRNQFEKLMLSLQSPLPNEHVLTLNTLTMLSAFGRENEQNMLEKTPGLLNMLLAHVGFYSDCALRLLMEQPWGNLRDFKAFWQNVISETEEGFRWQQHLLCECFPQNNPNYDGKCCDGCRDSQVLVCLNKLPNMAHSVATEIVGGQVLRIGNILRNFSFQPGNACKMAMSVTMLRFLLVAGESYYGNLPQISFDIISNITKYITLIPSSSHDKGILFQLHTIMTDFVTSTFMNSGDRFKILRCLEALQGLAVASGEREAKLRIFGDMRLFEKLFQFLTLKEDTILVINCLECLLAATEEGMGESICDKIMESVRGCIGTLVSYLTVDLMENFVEREDGIRNEKFRTELVGIERFLREKKPSRDDSKAVSKGSELNGSVGSPSVVNNKPSRVVSNSSLNSSRQSQEKYRGASSSSSQKKIGPSDEFAAIMENIKKIPEGKPITLILSPDARSLFERSPEFEIKRLNFPSNHPHSPNYFDNCKKVCVELVYHQNNNLAKEAPNGKICTNPSMPSLSSSLPASFTKSGDNVLETAFPFLCRWNNCGSRHVSKSQLRWHVYLCHIPNGKDDISTCKWKPRALSMEICTYPRNKYDLLEHLMEHHYNDKALEQALHQHISETPASPAEKAMICPGQDDCQNGTNGDPEAAAFVYCSQQQQQFEEKEEHVVNKSVHLTAALILRNFANNSEQARRSLKQHEMHLAEVAMGGSDVSGIISHVLHII